MARRRRRKRYTIKPRGIIIIVVFLLLIIALAAGLVKCAVGGGDEKGGGLFEGEPKVTSEDISILCVGDIMAHEPQYRSVYDSASGTYDFSENYTYVKEYIEGADLALCNVETVFADMPPQGYPTFNAPDGLADTIKSVGFDVAITSNNHMIDQGTAGVERTLQVLRERGLTTVGSRLTEDENEYALVRVGDVNVGIVAYTYETTGTNSTKSLNGMAVPEAVSNRICSFNPEVWETDITKITNNIDLVRKAGADIVVCYFHWGEEYHQDPMDYQVKMAEVLAAENGVDVIFASHPHILEKADTVYSEKYGKTVPVYYSMGNFISNQRAESLGPGRRNTEDGIMAEVTFTVTKEDGAVSGISLKEATALPTWVSREKEGGRWLYELIPLTNDYGQNSSLVNHGNVSRADTSLTDSVNTIGADYPRDDKGRLVIYKVEEPKQEE